MTMPLRWEIVHEQCLVLVTVEGTVRYDDIETYMRAIGAAGAISYRKLFDSRSGNVDLSESDLMSYAGMAAGYASTATLGPVAVVISGERLPRYAVLHRLAVTPRPFGLFQDIDEARQWLLQQSCTP